MTFANLIVLITIDRARFIATFRVLDFPLRLLLVPFLLILGIITIGVPREKLAVLINNQEYGRGKGTSNKEASQVAAQSALEQLQQGSSQAG